MRPQRQLRRFLIAAEHQASGASAGLADVCIRRGDRGEDEGRVWKQLLAVAQRELQRERVIRDDHVDSPTGELPADVVAQGEGRVLLGEAIRSEILREERDRGVRA